MALKPIGLILVLLSVGLFYVALDQYQSNANAVRAMTSNPWSASAGT